MIFEPPRFMSPYTAIQQILHTERERHPEAGPSKSSAMSSSKRTTDPIPDDPQAEASTATLLDPSKTLAISLSRIGTPTQRLISGTLLELSQLTEEEFGPPLHSVVIIGRRLHPLELEYAGQWTVGGDSGDWWKVSKEVYGVEREGR